MSKVKYILFFWILLAGVEGFAQNQHALDSVYAILKSGKDDSNKVNAFLYLSGQAQDVSSYIKSDSLATEGLHLAERISYPKGIAYCHIYFGLNAYYQGNYAGALQEYFHALEIVDKIGDKRGLGITLNNIGLSYNGLNDYDRALEYYTRGLLVKEKSNDKRGISSSLNNIGLIYLKKKIYDSALAYYNKSLEIKESYGDKRGMALNYTNIGTVYTEEGKYDSALGFMLKALNIKREYSDKYGIASTCLSMGDMYFRQGKYDAALKNSMDALDIAKEIGAMDEIQDAEKQISEIYLQKKDGLNALKHYQEYIAARDSIFSRENTKKTVQAEMNFEFEKRQAAATSEQDKKDALQKEQSHKQKLVIYFISGILLLVAGFAVFAYRSFLQKQKTNNELDNKNKKLEQAYSIIEDKNKSITDSITYAKRIQRAMLPTKREIKSRLPESFVLFKPKAIVSGDFYFFATTEGTHNGKVFIAAVDCTGHGVPGAFMSMIGYEKLEDALKHTHVTGEILRLLNKSVRSSLHQSAEKDTTRDGMDIALCAIDGLNMEYAGANRPLWIIRQGTDVIEEVKPDKKAIGGFTSEKESFATRTLTLQKGDTIYMFSDGYADQFGGPEGKKLTTRKFKELLLSVRTKTMAEQKKELSVFIEKWRGRIEQLDDILIIGIRV